jgi:PKD repeat protein
MAAKTGEQVMVNASASTAAPGRRIVVYAWDFGDGVKKEGVTSSHDYDNAGTFAIILTISDDAGQQATTTRMVTITAGAPPSSGQAQFAVLTTPTPPPDVPADLTLLFQLLTSGSTSFLSRTTILRPMADATYNIAAGSSYTRGDKTGGIIKGQFVGTLTPLNGKFSGSMTHISGSCLTERTFSGVVGDFLEWTGGALVAPDCSVDTSGKSLAWNYPKFSMVKK